MLKKTLRVPLVFESCLVEEVSSVDESSHVGIFLPLFFQFSMIGVLNDMSGELFDVIDGIEEFLLGLFFVNLFSGFCFLLITDALCDGRVLLGLLKLVDESPFSMASN